MKNIFFLALMVAVLASCTEDVKLDLDQQTPSVVIDGQVTNRAALQRVKLSRTVDFYQNGKTPRITDGTVLVEDDAGNSYPFVHNPRNHPDSAGYYKPVTPFTGVIGRTYKLTVEADGKTFTAEDRMFSVLTLDSLTDRKADKNDDDEASDPKEPGKIYELQMYAREPQDEENFYLFKFYRNDSLKYYEDTDVYVSDDALLAENIDGITSPVYYAVGDHARVEGYSLTRRAYVYYTDLNSILNNDGGGMFGPIPASPRTNIEGGALGIFQVSSLSDISTVVVEDDD
jgi:hypothetical protein